MWLGKQGQHLWELANGSDRREVVPKEPAKSIGAETTFEEDTQDPQAIYQTLLELSKRVGSRLRAEEVQARTLTLKFRTAKFHTYTRSITLQEPTDHDSLIYQQALHLVERLPRDKEPVRLLGIAGSHLLKLQDSRQLSLFSSSRETPAKIDKTVDAIRARFGEDIIFPGSLLHQAKRIK